MPIMIDALLYDDNLNIIEHLAELLALMMMHYSNSDFIMHQNQLLIIDS